MKRAKYYLASAVGASLLAGVAGTAAMSQERAAAPERSDARPQHAMKQDGVKHDGKRWHGRHHHGFKNDRGRMHGGMFGHIGGRHTEGMLAFAKAELNVTDEQEPRWEALAIAVRNTSDRMKSLREEARAERKARAESGDTDAQSQRQRLDAAQRLDRMEALAELRLESVREINAAFQPLYASFSDEQKEKLSSLLRTRGRR